MPRGSIGLVAESCHQGGGANLTQARRWALTINYVAGGQPQQENLMLAHSREPRAKECRPSPIHQGSTVSTSSPHRTSTKSTND